jgi:hypothetical protein
MINQNLSSKLLRFGYLSHTFNQESIKYTSEFVKFIEKDTNTNQICKSDTNLINLDTNFMSDEFLNARIDEALSVALSLTTNPIEKFTTLKTIANIALKYKPDLRAKMASLNINLNLNKPLD